jgi:hypothetical protein
MLCLLLMVIATAGAHAEPRGQRFVAIAFHDIVDQPGDLTGDAVTVRTFVQFLDWLKGTGWTTISLDDVSAAARGARRLPDKAILLTFDDGFRSLYTRVFPLLKAYRYPAVAALVGSWMEDGPDGTVLYGDKRVPRTNFVSWAEVREMEASGLIEFASHSYDLHRGVQANPQGNLLPAAVTWRYDPLTRTYEDDAQYTTRIRADLRRSRDDHGGPARASAPHDRMALRALHPACAGSRQRNGICCRPDPGAGTGLHLGPFRDLSLFPAQNPSFGDIVRNLRFEPERPATRRIACLALDALAAAGSGRQQDEAARPYHRGRASARRQHRHLSTPTSALPSPAAPLGAVYFPTRLRPLRMDLLGRATAQIRSRGGADVYLHLPLAAAAAAVGKANVPRLFAEMLRHARPDGIVIDMPLPAAASRDRRRPAREHPRPACRAQSPTAERRGTAWSCGLSRGCRDQSAAAPDARHGAACRPTRLGRYRPAAAGRGRRGDRALAGRLRAEGWLRPEVSGRVAFSLPAEPERQIEALRQAQRQGASAFALCPKAPALPPSAALSAAFSRRQLSLSALDRGARWTSTQATG